MDWTGTHRRDFGQASTDRHRSCIPEEEDLLLEQEDLLLLEEGDLLLLEEENVLLLGEE